MGGKKYSNEQNRKESPKIELPKLAKRISRKRVKKRVSVTIVLLLLLQTIAQPNLFSYQPKTVFADVIEDTQAPTAPSNVNATAVSGSGIQIKWDDAVDNNEVTGYKIYKDNVEIGTSSETNYTDDTSLDLTGQKYTVKAFDASNNISDADVVASSTNTTSDTQPPTAPANVTSAVSDSAITITWDIATDNVGVEQYTVYCNDTYLGIATETNYTYGAVNQGTTYSFYVTASDLAGNVSEKSNFEDITITDAQPPTAPANVASVVSGSAIAITWDIATDNVGVEQYTVYCNGPYLGITTETSYTYGAANQGTTYSFYVTARDLAGNVSEKSNIVDIIIADAQAPTAPANASVAVSGSGITITWDAATDNIGVEQYKVYCNDAYLGTTTETSYIYAGANQGATYTFYVIAFDFVDNISEKSNTVDITMSDTQPPTVPQNLTIIDRTSTSIKLEWEESTDNIEVVGYDIYQETTVIGSVTGSSIYVVAELEQSTEYTFMVKAKDKAGNISEASNLIMAATLPEKPTNLKVTESESGITITWNKVANVDEYELNINGKIIDVGTATSYILTNQLPNSKYEFKVCSIHGTDKSEWSDTTDLLTVPDKVVNLKAKVISESVIQLNWDVVEGTLSYEVEIDGTVVGTVMENKYLHQSITTDKVNNYRVRTVNGELKGLWSDSVLKASQIIIKGGTISQNTLWDGSEGSYYIVQGTITIAQGVALQVMPGTIVKFNSAIGMTVNGTLTALGTVENPIVFTALKDSEYGGSGVTGNTDCWRGINAATTGDVVGDNIKIKNGGYRGYDYYSGAISVYGALTLTNSEIKGSDQNGIYINSGKNIIVKNTTIDGSNGNGITVMKAGAGSFTVENNTISNNGYYPISICLDGITSSYVIQRISDNILRENEYCDLVYLNGYVNADITISGDKYHYLHLILMVVL